MSISWKEASNNYKTEKASRSDGYEDTPYKKKARPQKTKRSNHKHKYIPAILLSTYYTHNGEKRTAPYLATYCEICGRVDELRFWITDRDIEKFKEKNPNYVYKDLPDGWSFFKDKNIPI